jgi:carbon storage regulator CsrA
MLVISRCLNSGIRIGDNVRIKVLRLGHKRVTLGVDAPAEVQVRRDEVVDQDSSREAPATHEVPLRVMVVEDTPVHALLIERVLSHRGVKNVVRTSTGEDAIRLLSLARINEALRPDLVLLDLQLPGISGHQVLETIKSVPALCSIPVVILSCTDSDEEVARCMAAGANAFVAKSPEYEKFRASLIRITDFWTQVRTTSRPSGDRAGDDRLVRML